MERVGILINKLQEQLAQKADWKNMLITTQMLQAELTQNVQKQNGRPSSKVAVVLPYSSAGRFSEVAETIATPLEIEVKDIEIPEVADIESHGNGVTMPATEPERKKEDAPEEVVANAFEPSEKAAQKASTGWLFNPGEVPTLAHQEKTVYELNDTMVSDVGSLNETLKEEKSEVAHSLQGTPIKDLKKAISINDRHRFIHDLFRDDETMYERSIKTINGFNIFPEAEYWIQRELKLKLGWDVNTETVKAFDQLVKRRFS